LVDIVQAIYAAQGSLCLVITIPEFPVFHTYRNSGILATRIPKFRKWSNGRQKRARDEFAKELPLLFCDFCWTQNRDEAAFSVCWRDSSWFASP